MTQQHAAQAANVILGLAAAGAAYYVLRTPELRRLAWRVTSAALLTTLPAWFNRELWQAWAESATPAKNRRDMMSA